MAYGAVWKSTSRVPDRQFNAVVMTESSGLRSTRHAIEQASRRWRGGYDSAAKFDVYTERCESVQGTAGFESCGRGRRCRVSCRSTPTGASRACCPCRSSSSKATRTMSSLVAKAGSGQGRRSRLIEQTSRGQDRDSPERGRRRRLGGVMYVGRLSWSSRRPRACCSSTTSTRCARRRARPSSRPSNCDDELTAGVVAPDKDHVLVLTAAGYGKRVDVPSQCTKHLAARSTRTICAQVEGGPGQRRRRGAGQSSRRRATCWWTCAASRMTTRSAS